MIQGYGPVGMEVAKMMVLNGHKVIYRGIGYFVFCHLKPQRDVDGS